MKQYPMEKFEAYEAAFNQTKMIKESLESLEQLVSLDVSKELILTYIAANISRTNVILTNLKKL